MQRNSVKLKELDSSEKILLRIGDIKNTNILESRQSMIVMARLVEETK